MPWGMQGSTNVHVGDAHSSFVYTSSLSVRIRKESKKSVEQPPQLAAFYDYIHRRSSSGYRDQIG